VRYEVGDQLQPYIISFSREEAIVKESEAMKVSLDSFQPTLTESSQLQVTAQNLY